MLKLVSMFVAAAAVTLMLGVTGCSTTSEVDSFVADIAQESPETPETPEISGTELRIVDHKNSYLATIAEVPVGDKKVQCIIVTEGRHSAGGLSCDWDGAK